MKGCKGKMFHLYPHLVKLATPTTIASGYATVTFPEPFVSIPEVMVVRPIGETGVWVLGDVTVTGGTLTISATSPSVMPVGQEFHIGIFAHERL